MSRNHYPIRPHRSRRNRAAGALLLTVALVLFGFGLVQAAGSAQTEPGTAAVVRAGGAILLDEIDGTEIAALPTAALVHAVARTAGSDWIFVQTEESLAGWVDRQRLLVAGVERLPLLGESLPAAQPLAESNDVDGAGGQDEEPAPMASRDGITRTGVSTAGIAVSATVVLTDARLNVRSGPGTGYAVIDKLLPQSTILVDARDEPGAWVRLAAVQAPAGWVSAEYLAPFADLLALPNAGGREIHTAAETVQADAIPPSARVQPTAASGLAGRLAIQSARGGMIWVYELTTGRLYPLTHGFDPAISPDGQTVAFTRGGGESGLYLIDIDGGNERLIFGERPEVFAPKWRPDGSEIVFVRGDEWIDCYLLPDGRCMVLEWLEANRPNLDRGELEQKRERLYKLSVVDRNGHNFTDLPGMETASAPDWNSAGIVYATKSGLQMIDRNADAEEGSELLYFDILKQYHQDPDWSPRGGPVLYQQREASHWEIFRINPDGSGRTALTRPTTALVDALPSNVTPVWNPDGTRIAFLSNRTPEQSAGAWRVWVMNSDGSGQHPLPFTLPIEYGFAGEQVIDWGP